MSRPIVKIYVTRMTTSREGPTKYEHFVTLENSAGQVITPEMRHNPAEAVASMWEWAEFLRIQPERFLIDGREVKPCIHLKRFLSDDEWHNDLGVWDED